MKSSWRQLCKSAEDMQVDGDRINVKLADERHQWIMVEETERYFELSAFVVRKAILESLEDFPIRAWQRNRNTQLVSFRVDKKWRLLGEAWLPKAGVSADEFLLVVRQLAFECDRYEYLLTGADRE